MAQLLAEDPPVLQQDELSIKIHGRKRLFSELAGEAITKLKARKKQP